MLVADIPQENQVGKPTGSYSVAAWFEYCAPDFTLSNVNKIFGAKKLIEAKAALKGSKGSKGSFTLLVEGLGMDLGKAERLMVIARHPVLSNSAHAPILPLNWMTQYTLAKISPGALAQLIADERMHPGLERKEAERMVEQARGQNSTNGSGGGAHTEDHGADGDDGDGGDHSECHGASDDDDEGRDHHDLNEEDDGEQQEPAETSCNTLVTQDDVGSNSRSEIERKLARGEELEREAGLWAIQKSGFESEIDELRARLDETQIPHQRRLFRQALRPLQKAEASDIHEKEKRRSLRTSATTDFVELVRSAARDGLGLNRFDIICRPETH